MSTEPERPIEKLLRAFARRRRQQGGERWEMHPATRRLLQQEVAARFKRPPKVASRRPGWWPFQGWFRPLAALGALACVSLVVWISVHSSVSNKPEELLAKNEPAQNSPAENPAPAAGKKAELLRSVLDERAATGQSAPMADRKTAAEARSPLEQTELVKQPAQLLVRAPTAAQPAGAAAAGSLAQAPLPDSALAKDKEAAPSPASDYAFRQRYGLGGAQPPPGTAPAALPALSTAAPAKPPAPDEPVADTASAAVPADVPLANLNTIVANNGFSTGLVQYGRFTAAQNPIGNPTLGRATLLRSAVPPAKGQAANQILLSFRVEQSGQQLRVIDKDGSVYSGSVQQAGPPFTPAPQGLADLTGAQAAPVRSSLTANSRDSQTTQPGPVQLFFRVSGTNHSSNQQVVFSGALNAGANVLETPAPKADQASNRRLSFDRLSVSPPVDLPLQNLRLSGKAVIGGSEEMRIEAVPAAP